MLFINADVKPRSDREMQSDELLSDKPTTALTAQRCAATRARAG